MGETPNRRTLLKRAGVAAGITAAAGLAGAGPASAARVAQAGAAAARKADAGSGLPDFAPVPKEAFGPAVNADGYYVGQIDGNLYWVTDSFYNSIFLTTPEGVVVVDAPPTIGNNLLRAIADVTSANGRPSTVTHLVYSHSHADHAGASSILGDDVIRIGHSETRSLLLRDNDPNRPPPTVTFDDRYVLEVGGERLELAYHGPNHSPDNIYIHVPDHDTLMLVDVIFPGWVPFENLAVSQDIPGWVEAQEIAMQYPWTTLVGGHVGRLGDRADGELQIAYIADLAASVRGSLNLNPTPYFEKYDPSGNAWAIFRTYLNAVARQAADPVVAKYLGVLAAADVFTQDHAWTLLESFRIDNGELGPFGIHP